MRKKAGVLVWSITFLVSAILLLVIPEYCSKVIVLALVLSSVSFITDLVVWLITNNHTNKAVYNAPLLTVIVAFVLVQIGVNLVVAVKADGLSVRAVLLLYSGLIAIELVMVLLLCLAKEHVCQVDYRQKNHHVEL